MKHLAFNPYLPPWEHVPDGEPHVFGDRLYIFGSHDDEDGDDFCVLDYVCWSAPLSDLGDWRYEGVIYRKDQDPLQTSDALFSPPGWEGKLHPLFAPDVTQGPNGQFYLYYSVAFSDVISVAVADCPVGPYEFLAHVANADGSRPGGFQWFDPAVLSEFGKTFLYVGSAPEFRFPGMPEGPIPGAMVMELAPDMHTIVSEPVCVANGIDTAKGTSFEDHPFFEASSIRHFGSHYYFIYSSLQGHELCYATAPTPTGPFTYQGVLLSNGDMGLNGNTQPHCYMGNNHGSLIELNGTYYIFGHRHTYAGQFSRQGIAESIQMDEGGRFVQASLSSCGLNGGPLPATNVLRADIACHLQGPDRAAMTEMLPLRPQRTPESTIPYVAGQWDKSRTHYQSFVENLRPGATVGFLHLAFTGAERLVRLCLRGNGVLSLHLDSPESPSLVKLFADSQDWTWTEASFSAQSGSHGVFFTVDEGASLSFAEFQFV